MGLNYQKTPTVSDRYDKTERTLPLKAAVFFSLNSLQKGTLFCCVYLRLLL